LRQVRVLKFVYEDVFKLVSVGFAHHRVVFEDAVGINQHIVEIHGVVLDQTLLVLDKKALHLFIAEVPDRIVLGLDQVVFGARDGVQQR